MTSTNSTDNKKALFLEALRAAAGNVTLAAQKAGIERTTYYYWLKTNKKFAQQAAEVKESLIDLAETKLMQAIQKGNMTAIIFFLKCQAKDRGYVERQEFAGVENAPIQVEYKAKYDLSHLSDEELDHFERVTKKIVSVDEGPDKRARSSLH